MERYDWNTFSLIIDPRLPGEQELKDEFEEHGNEQRNCLTQSLLLRLIIYSSKKTSCNRNHLKGQKK
jgi:hypothetical protein